MSDVSLHGGHAAIQDGHQHRRSPSQEDRERVGRQCVQEQKSPHLGSSAADDVQPPTAVQVVDRLRWWRTHRVREQPLPVHHVVLRGSYANYSPFGTRPLATDVARLLQRARVVQVQYRDAQQRQQQQQRQRQRRQCRDEVNAPAPIAVTRSVSRAASSGSLVCAGGLGEEEEEERERVREAEQEQEQQQQQQHEQRREHCDVGDDSEVKDTPDNKRSITVAGTPPPSPRHADEGATLGSAALVRQRGAPSTHTAAVGVPPHSRVSRVSSSACAVSPKPRIPSHEEMVAATRLLALFRPRAASAPPRPRWRRCAARPAAVAAAATTAAAGERERVGAAEAHRDMPSRASTSDEMTEVRRASRAADAVVVLHHAPRLVLYDKGLNPRTALRAARISSDALEGLSDAAAEGSAEVFAMTSLPLSAFERFFYQQQLCGPTETAAPASGATTCAADAAHLDDVERVEETLYFGSPLTASPACSPFTAVPSRYAGGAVLAASRERRRRGGTRSGGPSMLRAVSVPALPPVYKGGCPPLSATTALHHPRSVRSSQQQQQQRRRRRSPRRVSPAMLPAGLRSGALPQDGAHLCLRVDDLQDVYVFHPVVDMIGKGAFSKVYAAVPILRGRDGLTRFTSQPLAVGSGGGAEGRGDAGEPGRTPSAARGVSPARRTGRAPTAALATVAAAGGVVGGEAAEAPPALDDGARRRGRRAPCAPAALQSVPVVALKVIPRKARPQSKAPPTGPASATALPSAAAVTAEGDDHSVRRELVEIEREVSILRRLHHSGCSQFFEALRTPDAFVIAMRVFPGSMDARHYLSRYGAPSEARTALLLFQLVSTVHYLHTSFGLIHRDIKLENILMSEADAAVSDLRIREVLGTAVHKTDAAAAAGAGAGAGGGGDDDLDDGHHLWAAAGAPAAAAQLGSSTLAHSVDRLLRVTLIDFGLARRTRASAVDSATTAATRTRGVGGQPGSRNASVTSPSHLMCLPPLGATPPAGSPHGGHPHHTNSSSNSCSAAAPPQWTLGGGAASFVQSSNSVSNSYTSPMVGQPPRKPLLRRSPSAAVGAGAPRLGGVSPGTGGMASSMSRAGMPSPLPSTANMFTGFLDVEEEQDEEDLGGGGGGGGSAGVAAASTTTANTAAIVAGLGRGSRQDMAEEEEDDDGDSGASSTDVSASETESESDGASTVEPEEREAEMAEDGGDAPHGTPRPTLLSAHVLTAGPRTAGPDHPGALGHTSDGVASATAPPQRSAPGTHSQLPPVPPPPPPPPAPPAAAAAAATAAAAVLPTYDDAEATLLLTPCGTERYLPPEVLSWILEHGWVRRSTTVGLARAMDLYAIGIVGYVLLSGCFPFNASSRATLLQQQQRVPRCNSARWSGVSAAAASLVQGLLEPNPLKRMTATEALGHPFLREARQLAEKLGLVPHSEEAGAPAAVQRSVLDRERSSSGHHHHRNQHTPQRYRAHSGGSVGSPGVEKDGSPQTRLRRTASGAIVAAAAAAAATVSSSASRATSSPMCADRTRMGTSVDTIETRRSGCTSLGVGEEHRGRSSGAPTPPLRRSGETSSRAFLHPVDGVAVPTGTGTGTGTGGPHPRDTAFSGGAASVEDDVLASITREVLGEAPSPLRTAAAERHHHVAAPGLAASPSPAAPTAPSLPSAAPTVHPAMNAPPATPTAAGAWTLGSPESVSRRPSLTSTTTTTKPAEGGGGGGDDLFESLYNNIMLSE
ncbi:protein kinase [Novymonas esmeraldas]|uniref:Protein kinase n=1 Tax=Novymonas esmeraldas TaxID=1808958 RepID=A0AAW0EKP9_9TRYP